MAADVCVLLRTRSRIAALTPTEHGEIFKVMESYHVAFSRNNNGCFFNMSFVDEAVIEEIERFVDYCHENKQRIDEYNKQLNECKLRGTLRPAQPLPVSPPPSVREEEASDDESSDATLESDDAEASEAVVDMSEAQADVAAAAAVPPPTSVTMRESALRKKATSRFVVAKKRFAKRHVHDRRMDFEPAEVLRKEPPPGL